MKTLRVFEKGDKVKIKGIITDVTVTETGIHKYRVKDEKSPCTVGTWFTADELEEVKVEKEEKEEKKK